MCVTRIGDRVVVSKTAKRTSLCVLLRAVESHWCAPRGGITITACCADRDTNREAKDRGEKCSELEHEHRTDGTGRAAPIVWRPRRVSATLIGCFHTETAQKMQRGDTACLVGRFLPESSTICARLLFNFYLTLYKFCNKSLYRICL